MSFALTRRNFLRTGAPAVLSARQGLSRLDDQDVNCILLMLVGGPSHLDTWDMKPHAPMEVRGPFRPIRTNVPGIEISEIFPRMARHADKYTLVRSLHHEAMPVHDVGHQAIQTGRRFSHDLEHPHFGCVVTKLKGPRGGMPAHVLLPGPIGATGGNMPHGQSAGFIGEEYDPVTGSPERFGVRDEPEARRRAYGLNQFGQSCLAARRLVEQGVRFVTVNMFDTVFDRITWDIHGYEPFCGADCYRRVVGPMFDMAFSSLIEDLSDRRLLDTTVVLALSEFGRSPRLNYAGGRDHWPQCWTAVVAGGPLKRGEVIGSSDEIGAYPKDRPITPSELAATVYRALGLDPHTQIPDTQGRPVPLVDPDIHPVAELFA